ARDEVILRRAIELRLELGDLHDEHRLPLVEAAELDEQLSHQSGFVVGDGQVRVRGTAQDVRETGYEAGMFLGHRVEALHDPPNRFGLLRACGHAGRLGRIGRGPRSALRAQAQKPAQHPASPPYQRPNAGWPGGTAMNVPRQVAHTLPLASRVAAIVARSSVESTTCARRVSGPSIGVGRSSFTA